MQFVELPRGTDGKRRRKKITGKGKTEVARKAKRVEAELLVTGATSNEVMTVEALMAEYLETARPNVKPRTIETYEKWSEWYVVPYLGAAVVAKLQPADIRAWHRKLAEDGYSTNTVKAAHRCLRQALGQAERDGVVTRNVCRIEGGPKGGEPAKPVEPFSPSEVSTIRAAVDGWRLRVFVYLTLGAGLRLGEAFGVTWDAVDFEEGLLEVRAQVQDILGGGKEYVPYAKTAAGRRTVALSPVVIEALRRHRREMVAERKALGAGAIPNDSTVIVNAVHELGDRANSARELKALCAAAGVQGVNPHRLRHTYVSLALDAGVPLEAISEQVGHRNVATTKDIYGKLQDRGRRRVANAVGEFLES